MKKVKSSRLRGLDFRVFFGRVDFLKVLSGGFVGSVVSRNVFLNTLCRVTERDSGRLKETGYI